MSSPSFNYAFLKSGSPPLAAPKSISVNYLQQRLIWAFQSYFIHEKGFFQKLNCLKIEEKSQGKWLKE